MASRVRQPSTKLLVPLAAATALAIVLALRRRSMRWGASADELAATLPGDELLPLADLVATRALTIAAGPEHVWPWLAQIGQGRGGFYSYDWLENLAGCDIHSVERIVPEWQQVAEGDAVRLAPEVPLLVARVDHGKALVLQGAIPMGSVAPPYEFVWAFTLASASTPTDATRLVVRERYRYTSRWAPLVVEPAEAISGLMTPKMLRGIRRRAEGRAGIEIG